MIADDLKTLKRITDTLVSNGYLVDQTKEWEYAFDAMPDAIFVINLEHKIRFINKKLSKLLGMTKDEVFNKDCHEVILGELSLCDFSDCKIEPREFNDVFLSVLKGWYSVTQAPIKSNTDELLGFICILKDVTETEVARRELAASELKYRTIVKHAPAALYDVDFATFKISNTNDIFHEYTGYAKEELSKLDARSLLTPESLQLFIKRIKAATLGIDIPHEVEFEIIRKDGTNYWAQLYTSYKYNDIGMPIGARVVAVDINEKKLVKLEADRKTRLLDSIYKASPGGIGIVTYPDREIVWVNDKVCQIVGYTKEELIGKSVRMLYPTEEEYKSVGKAKYGLISQSATSVGTIKARFKHKDGHIIPVLLISAKIQDEPNRVIFNVLDLDFICNNTDELSICT